MYRKKLIFLYYVSNKIPKNIIGNYDQIMQVILNIIENSVKYTEKGGIYIKLILEKQEIKKIAIKFIIKDTGIGISEENIKKIYDMFYVENEKSENSFGIGLYNTKKIIDSLGGKIELKSKKGQGSIFELELEFDVLEAVKNEYDKLSRKEVVIISDIPLLNEYLVDILEEYEISYYILDSYEEYLQIKEEMEEKEIVFISKNKCLEYKNNYNFSYENIIILGENDEKCFENMIDIKEINPKFIKEILDINIKKEEEKLQEKIKKDIPLYKNLTVLIVEDNDLNILYLQDILDLMGIKYDTAKTINEALEYLKENVYNIIFSDINIGESNGIEFIENINKEMNLKKIAVTAGVNDDIRKKCIEAGFDEFIEKPYSINEIIEILKKYFFEYRLFENNIKINTENKKYYEIFLENIDYETALIEKMNNEKSWEDIKKILHKVKSGVFILNEIELLENIFKMEEYAKKQNSEMIEKEICHFKENISKIREMIKDENSFS